MENDLFLRSVEFKVLKFFFLLKKKGTLEMIAVELNLTPSILRLELSKLEKLELIIGTSTRRMIQYSANQNHSSYHDLSDFLNNYIKKGVKLNFT